MYTIGSDPEFFVEKKNTRIVPSFEIVSRSKKKPMDLGEGFSMFYDNVTLEGNMPPAETLEEFVTNIRKLKIKMNKYLNVWSSRIVESSSERLFFLDLDDKRAKEFGCSPFYNSWTFQEEVSPEITENFRVAGFHLHIGYENTTDYPNELVNFAIARAFDFFVVYPSTFVDKYSLRKDNYGGFGKFRHKPYGIELRSLGGFFLRDNYLKWVYEQTIKTMDFVIQGGNVRNLLDLEITDISIQNAKEKLGIEMMQQKVKSEVVLSAIEKFTTI